MDGRQTGGIAEPAFKHRFPETTSSSRTLPRPEILTGIRELSRA